MEKHERLLLLALGRSVGTASFHRLLSAFGSADRVFGASLSELVAVCPNQLLEDNFRALVKGPDYADLEMLEETCRLRGIRLLTFRCEGYPAPLASLDAPPPFLFMQGEWSPRDAQALAVVGTRHPTAYGLRAGKEICLPLAQAGWTLVSGLARGIDTLAHDCALAAGGRTIAVVGTGLDRVYPAENEVLARRVAENGCVVSEFPPGVGPMAFNFPRRNRIISALSLGTLVVEAGTDSGALITAEFAVEQGREIFAVPGSIQSPASRGTHFLLREGAHLASGADDVVAVMSGIGGAAPARRFAPVRAKEESGSKAVAAAGAEAEGTADRVGAAFAPRQRAQPKVEAPEPHRRLLDLLTARAQSLEMLAEKATSAPRSLLPALLDLEMRGKVRRLPGALYRLS